MNRLVKTLFRLLSPGSAWMLALIPVSMAALIIALTSEDQSSVFAFVSYGLSAYTLAALIIGIPGFRADIKTFMQTNRRIVKIKTFLYENRYLGLYFTNVPVRIKVSLYISLSINLSYAALKMTTGLLYASFWFGAEAIFYLLLGMVRFIILRYMRKGGGQKHEYRVYRACGFLLFALNAALTGIVYQMIHQGKGKEYPGLLIYIVAAYTFFFLISSAVHLVRYRRLNSPILSAVKVINLTTSLVALYSLQIALFDTFGEDKNLELAMNSIFGTLLCLSIFGMAVLMVVRGYKKLKELDHESA